MNYESILSRALSKLFPDARKRSHVEAVLSDYGTEDFHREVPRVRCAILKIAGSDLENLRRFTEVACCDYRDVLAMAEYPEQSGRWSLRDENPGEYAKIIKRDLDRHRAWIAGVLDDT